MVYRRHCSNINLSTGAAAVLRSEMHLKKDVQCPPTPVLSHKGFHSEKRQASRSPSSFLYAQGHNSTKATS